MNDPETIEVILPVSSIDINHISPCVDSISTNMQRPFRLTVATFGFLKESAMASLNVMLRAICKGPWSLMNHKDSGYNGSIHASLEESKSEYQIVVPYDVRIQDDSWFGKMQQPLLSVASTSFCNGTQSRCILPPCKLGNKLYTDGSSVFMTTRKALQAVLKGVIFDKHEQDYDHCYFDAIMRSGMMAFYIPSMGTYRVEIGRKKRTNQGSRS